MVSFLAWLPILVALLLAGCATPYQPQSGNGGYAEEQVSANTWLVTFAGNFSTGLVTATDFALLRGAEIAEENGYAYFVLKDIRVGSDRLNVERDAQVLGVTGNRRYQIVSLQREETSVHKRPVVTFLVEFRETGEDDGGIVFSTRELRADIAGDYDLAIGN